MCQAYVDAVLVLQTVFQYFELQLADNSGDERAGSGVGFAEDLGGAFFDQFMPRRIACASAIDRFDPAKNPARRRDRSKASSPRLPS